MKSGGLRDLAPEFRPMLGLALPVIVAELGWMAMNVADTVILGRIGPEALGGVALGSMLHFVVLIFGIGLMFGLDTLVSQAFGAGRRDDGRRDLVQGLYLAAALTPLMMLTVNALTPMLGVFGVQPDVIATATPYVGALYWSTGPLMLFTALRRYMQAVNLVRPIMVSLLAANVVNVVAVYGLTFGRLGLPQWGLAGAGWGTCIARVFMLVLLVALLWLKEREDAASWRMLSLRPEWARQRRLIGLGLPAAVQLTLEVGVFAAATTLAGRFAAVDLAAHQVVLNVSSVTFMIPLGLASGAAVRVGQAVGRRDAAGARRAGWASLAMSAGFMTCTGLLFLTIPGPIVRLYTEDAGVIRVGTSLLFIAAFFQLFDGLQVVTTGALRGLGETRKPMLCNLVAHWGIGLPIGALLALRSGWGVVGLWVGLSAGLIAAGTILLVVWTAAARALPRMLATSPARESASDPRADEDAALSVAAPFHSL